MRQMLDTHDFQKLLKMREDYLKSLEIGAKSLGKTVKKNVIKQKTVITLGIVLVKIDAICLINALQKMNLSELMPNVLHLISHVQVMFFMLLQLVKNLVI